MTGPPSTWAPALWEFWRERVAVRWAAGESEAEAARAAADDVRRWVALGGEAPRRAPSVPQSPRIGPERTERADGACLEIP